MIGTGGGGEHHNEIVIVRHGHSSHDEGHHGGAWKIAFADFMTAMMAFFLVMWLINSTDEQTLAQVASYFSPIRLTDRTVTTRGVADPEKGGSGKETEQREAKKREGQAYFEPKTEPGERRFAEEELFSEPYNVLAKLAVRAARIPTRGGGGVQQEGNAGGEAFRDPFDPDFRKQAAGGSGPIEGGDPKLHPQNAEGGQPAAAKTADAQDRPAAGAQPPPDAASAGDGDKPAESTALPAEEVKEAKEMLARAKTIEGEVAETVKAAGLISLPDITVKGTPEGVLISLTDKANFEMFAISSAEPRPEMVVVMEKIAKVLEHQPGSIIISGHTDGRPFRSKTYDNWRLSTARAHISYYMLVRAGVNKSRVERIEGHADRSLKVPGNPRAAENRRIEILLRPAKT
jgi:chemotaxis protein MotB